AKSCYGNVSMNSLRQGIAVIYLRCLLSLSDKEIGVEKDKTMEEGNTDGNLGIFGILCGIVPSYGGIKAAKRFHDNAIKRVLRLPANFFDITPLGRIIVISNLSLNILFLIFPNPNSFDTRFSKDVDTCDNLLSESYR
ncbi:11736_t:CDS:2, partial [Racocetra persica]